ncbi:MAG TPA: helix-turn-helix domain-containing protein, partial [Candidatus Polarisedimenticolaceae bacterium]|nr:helix-turn-helix domain-containing protein [Candidatus Polarisedimenticolaceae bacterium]
AAIEQAAIVARGDVIEPEDLPSQVRESRQSTPTGAAADRDPSKRPFRDAKRDVVEVFERGYLGALLERHAGNVTAASQQAGMLRSALQRLLRKYGLKSAEFRKGRRPGVRAVAGESPDRSR